MNDQPTFTPVHVTDWKAKIAEVAAVDVTRVDEIMTKYGIEVQSVLPRRRTITFTSIALKGTKFGLKKGDVDLPESEIDFEWSGLDAGLWVLASVDNNTGKSSVLNILKAAIKGDFPGVLKADVWSWLSELVVEFRLDETLYRVVATKPVSSKSTKSDAEFRACLERKERDSWKSVVSEVDGSAFEDAMSDFFMQELGFEKFRAYHKDADTLNAHGWPSMASSLFITGAAPSLFSEVVIDALALRLLQMFIGLPWVSTFTGIQSAMKQLEAQETRVGAANKRTRDALLDEIAALKQQRDDLQVKKASLPDRDKFRREQMEADRELSIAIESLRRLRREAADLEPQLEAASVDYDESRNKVIQLEDEMKAGRVFRRLRPTTCPSCDGSVDKPIHDPGNCPLCGQKETAETDETAERIASLRDQTKQAKAVKDELEKTLKALEKKLKGVEGSRATMESRLDAAQMGLEGAHASGEIDDQILGLTGGIEALERALPAEVEVGVVDDVRVLKVAIKVTEECFHEMQATLLSHFSQELQHIASRIGVENLQNVDVKSNKVDIMQGGTSLPFGKLNKGENLRFRIAAALAAVETAKWSGVGRHPGLLVLDSPAAHELSKEHYSAVLAGLQSLVKDRPDVQIVVGALMSEQISEAVSSQHLRYAKQGDKLF
jgi:hypothetical protein